SFLHSSFYLYTNGQSDLPLSLPHCHRLWREPLAFQAPHIHFHLLHLRFHLSRASRSRWRYRINSQLEIIQQSRQEHHVGRSHLPSCVLGPIHHLRWRIRFPSSQVERNVEPKIY